MGAQTWVTITTLITELLIVLKFDWETATKPLPFKVAVCWGVFISGLMLWTIWNFGIKPSLQSSKSRSVKRD